MSTSGGMGKEMDMLVRHIATRLSVKRGEKYGDTVGFVRRRIRFDLLRTCVISLRGYKKTAAPESFCTFSISYIVPQLPWAATGDQS